MTTQTQPRTQPRTKPRKALMSWSSGKDSAYALHLARANPKLEIIGLLTTINASADRVAMHGVRHELLRRQAASLGLPVQVIELPHPCSNEIYEQRMGAAVERARELGVEVMIFGDLFLADIRAYREQQLAGTGLEPVFPLWGADTRELAEQMLRAGVVATLTCVDLAKLPIELVGRRWDASLLRELPEGVDPCGERGEFHTFVSDGPGFAEPISHQRGEVVERDGFGFADLL
ncbi:adenine nucleotide alpha hydrolase [Enhygromyxa salina]|uniref:ATP-binding region n=1 Tax=Enhygromyxa salina TaxID=215803 RepID=A0A2S9Y8A0_9BACT|nr:adenine nucleotide alpha hydrolase [Enhygromyxa salina]PRQ01246.1 ATP-binding region [Enhygromyxa salina]